MEKSIYVKDVAVNAGNNLSVTQLIEVLEGRNETIGKRSALQALRFSESAEALPVVKRLLADKNGGTELRYEAAIALAKIKDSSIQNILLESIQEEDGYVLSGILQSLALHGNEKALSPLLEIKQVQPEAEAALNFAKTMLAFRHGDERQSLPDAAAFSFIDLNGKITNAIDLQKTTDIDTALLSASVEKENLSGLTTAENVLLNINCGKNRFAFLTNNESKEKNVFFTLRKKSVAGFIMQKFYCPDTYSLKLYFLSDPAETENESNLYVINTRGKMLYAGKGNYENTQFNFWLKTVQQSSVRAAGIDISGSMDTLSNQIVFNRLISAKTLIDNPESVKHPSPIFTDNGTKRM